MKLQPSGYKSITLTSRPQGLQAVSEQ